MKVVSVCVVLNRRGEWREEKWRRLERGEGIREGKAKGTRERGFERCGGGRILGRGEGSEEKGIREG